MNIENDWANDRDSKSCGLISGMLIYFRIDKKVCPIPINSTFLTDYMSVIGCRESTVAFVALILSPITTHHWPYRQTVEKSRSQYIKVQVGMIFKRYTHTNLSDLNRINNNKRNHEFIFLFCATLSYFHLPLPRLFSLDLSFNSISSVFLV